MAASTSLKRHATDMARSALKNQLQAETELIKCDGRLSTLLRGTSELEVWNLKKSVCGMNFVWICGRVLRGDRLRFSQ
jgi:hypothetical protein